jgi:hypothetical protein
MFEKRRKLIRGVDGDLVETTDDVLGFADAKEWRSDDATRLLSIRTRSLAAAHDRGGARRRLW